MPATRQYAVLGPLPSGAETRGFLGCEMSGSEPRRDSPVVIVWLPNELTGDPKQLARLVRDTTTITSLRHPNIVAVQGLECFEEGWARIVEFADGEPLSRLLDVAREAGKPLLPTRVAARFVLDLCDAVRHAHEHGRESPRAEPIVNGGLRPDTVLVTFTGSAKASGYGAAGLLPGGVAELGSRAAYLAPEQVIGGRSAASAASDIYALGAILHLLVSGRPPFEGATNLEAAILGGTLEDPGLDGVAGRLLGVARTAMARRAQDRFPTAEALSERILSEVEGGEGIASREEAAELVTSLIPADAQVRTSRASLLSAAEDPDAVTLLSKRAAGPGEAAQPEPEAVADPGAVPAASAKPRAPIPREPDTVISEGPPVAPAPRDREATLRSEPPRSSRPPRSSQPPLATLGPSQVSETTSRIPGRGMSRGVDQAIDQVMAGEHTPAPIPRAPIREDSITAFRKDVGDSSRAWLLMVAAAAIAIIYAVFHFSKAPDELKQESARHALPKEAVEIALRSSGAAELPSEEADEQPNLVEPLTPDGGSAIADETPASKVGTLDLSTNPAVDVYDQDTFLGRTPLKVEVGVGRHRLRFTDKEKRLNVYKQYRILPGGNHKDSIEFPTSELVVDAPDGATILLNGSLLGTAPLPPVTIYQGVYHLKVMQGTKSWTKPFEAAPGSKITFKVPATNGD